MNVSVMVVIVLALLAAPMSAGCAEKTAPLLPQTPLMKAAPPAVLAHVMVSFSSKAHSGRYRGWNHSNKAVRHNPNRMTEEGKPDVASVFYPTIGMYDQADPVAIENHCQLAKMSGIDGFIFDLGDSTDFRTGKPAWRITVIKRYVKYLKLYDLKGVICYEDKVHWIWNHRIKTRKGAVTAAYRDMDIWMKLFEPVNYRVNGRPLLMFFSYEHNVEGKGKSRLSPAELKTWLDRLPADKRPIVSTQWFKPNYKGVLNGPYDWTLTKKAPPEMAPLRGYAEFKDLKVLYARRRKRNKFWLEQGTVDFVMGGSFPGFDDRGCWGWGKGPRLVERLDGKTYRYVWGEALADGMPVIQLATWNDWFEGTNIEPADEFGTLYLEITRECAAKLKGKEIPVADLDTPNWIYRIRKSTRDPAALRGMTKASKLIREGKFAQAEKTVDHWAKKLKLDKSKGWVQPAARNVRPRKR